MTDLMKKLSKFELQDQLILYLLRAGLNDEEKEYVQMLINNPELNWELFLGKAFYNRVNGTVYLNILNFESIPREVYLNLDIMFKAQLERVKEHNKVITDVSVKLMENGVKHAFLKGSVLNSAVFRYGTRISNDSDILVSVKDLRRVTELLESMGYIQGYYNRKTKEIIEASKQKKMFARVNTHELVSFIKKEDNVFFDVNTIDINFKLEALGSTETAEKLLDNTYVIEKDDIKVMTLEWEYFFIQLATHLYRESRLVTKILNGSDMHLYKFYDIYVLLNSENINIDWDVVYNAAKEYDLMDSIYYTLANTNTLFPGTVSDEIPERFKPENLEFMDVYIGKQGKNELYKWEKPFEQRVFDYRRKVEADKNIREIYDQYFDAIN